MQDFKRLRCWRKAHALYLNVFHTLRRMPRGTPASLRSQILRAADSIVSNIVEGSSSCTNRDFARFLAMSIRSSAELEGHLRKARDLMLIPDRTHHGLAEDTIEVRKMIFVLRQRVLGNDT